MMYFDLPPEPPAVEIVQAPIVRFSDEVTAAPQSPSNLKNLLAGAAHQPVSQALVNSVLGPRELGSRKLEPRESVHTTKLSWVSPGDSSTPIGGGLLAQSSSSGSVPSDDTESELPILPFPLGESGLGNENGSLPPQPSVESPDVENTGDAQSEAGADDDIDSVDIDVNEDEPLDTDGLPESSPESLPTERPEDLASQLQLTADFQEYDPESQIITARGNVVLRLNDAIIEANELWLNLINRYALATGDVLLTRGAQIVRGNRAEYNFIQQSGVIGNAVGTLFLPEIDNDFASPLEPLAASARRAYDPIARRSDTDPDQDSEVVVTSDGSLGFASTDAAQPVGSQPEGNLRQLRFETDELVFDVEGWRAQSVRITNDPFSPPELELRTDSLVLRNISPVQDELLLKNPRLVFDQGLSLPLLRNRILLSRDASGQGGTTVSTEALNPIPVSVGIDGSDRGGLYIGRKVPVTKDEPFQLSVTPQFFIARAFSGDTSSPINAENFGFLADLEANITPRTTLSGDAEVTSLNLSEIDENLRTNIRVQQLISDHRLELQYSYRERLFNGSLGFQDVQSSLGAVFLSPTIALNDSGLQLTYQAGAQLINAETDQNDLLLEQNSDTGRVTLGRYQASGALSQTFNLWRGEPKPATQSEGLRYTPSPVVPYLNLTTGLRLTGTYYSSDDFQNNLIASVGIEGQLGHFARDFGDYTRFNIGYAQSFLRGDDSPFLFDREVDRNVLSLGLTQQLYGPILIGFQTGLSLNADRDINTAYTLEYSRRTYGILLRYDASQNSGSIGFRLSNFSWLGDADPFDTPRVRSVESSVIER
ncbi:MAG: DUF3769 domain-containing protein [Cyanobacteria bacterium P01_A01_bin.116]